MSLDATTRIMNGYIEALQNRGDFGPFFTDDVTWTTVATGEQFQGRDAVCDVIVTMHTKLFDASPEVKRSGIADGYAFIEADFVGTHIGEFAGVAPTGAVVRVPYCVAYDVTDDGISALRAYLPVNLMMEQLSGAVSAAR